ncbi:Pre mRNA splicing factor cwc 21 [Fasciola gigantica]|uniref:Pre mRNA splicing factor cwc 21 n=1 Tax=Fasciola gigantica TaxID=46835 RepID=A0A504Z193_FASGI|nr:Pre mRNA splicing factor cwc 21 [Fasciola gigantica]
MYNGIGLPTPRGSGTNGYVQKNLAFIGTVKERVPYKTDDDLKRADALFFKEPNKEILEHERKRKVEVVCFERELLMEEQGYTEEEIKKKVSALRAELLEKMKAEELKKKVPLIEPADLPQSEHGRLVPKGTHEAAAVTLIKNTVFKEALGIGADFQDGNSMEQANQRRKEEEESKRLLEQQNQLSTMNSSSDETDDDKSRRKHHKEKKKRKKRNRSSSPKSSDSESSDDSDSRKEERHRKKRRSHEKSRSRKEKHSHKHEKRKRR